MGFFDRLKAKKESAQETVHPEPAAETRTHHVEVNLPSYFKAGAGEYHVHVDGEEHVAAPFSKLRLELPEGRHRFRAYSTPETLGEAEMELVIEADTVLSVTVDVRNRTISINCNDKVRSKKDFEEQFMKNNHIGKLESEGTDRKN